MRRKICRNIHHGAGGPICARCDDTGKIPPDYRPALRRERLMPNGIPRYIRCYDNGGATADRYTVAYTGRYRGRYPGITEYVGMSANPFHPMGFGQHGEYKGYYRGTGGERRIKFAELPPDCQRLVIRDYSEIWGIK